MKKLKNKIIIVTGGNGLLGKAILKNISNEGGIPICADININKNSEYDEFYCDVSSEESIENLLKEDKMKVVEGELRFLQNEWENIGPTKQEDWEEVKTKYWDTVKTLYAKIKGFYEGRREDSIKNYRRVRTIF